MRSLFASWGYDAQIERFQVLFPEPRERLLTMGRFKARLTEPRLKEDSTSRASGGLPPYNAYSCDGDVTAPIVYVNYGMPEDYDKLDRLGISVKGKIVLTRYGGGWRGLKPKLAGEHGAIGCLIYSDPRDDGYYQGDVYPLGAYRNQNGVQRGSVADMPIYPGDPLTPGIGATPDAKRLELKDVATITKIPCLPISYADARPLLQNLRGPVAPDGWRGALPLTYHIGPSVEDAHLELRFNWNRVEARDVVAKMPGSERPDEWVIRGNHHDAWVMGAQDPLSGAVTVLEQAKATADLAKTGWRPKRTLVFCLWDGEEPGLIGSTEWVETHEKELNDKAVAYVNSDTNGRGYLGMEGSYELQPLINGVARDVKDPEKGISVFDRARDRQLAGAAPSARPAIRAKQDIKIGALGSGSDYSPFIEHDGISALDLGFGGEDGGGIYHSTYDSFDWYSRFGDPGWNYELALSQVAGLATLRLADADVVPYRFAPLASEIGGYVKELVKLTDQMRADTEENNKTIDSGEFAAALDPRLTETPPVKKDMPPFLGFSPLQNAAAKLQTSCDAYDRAHPVDAPGSAELDRALIGATRAMLGAGLPKRPWYRHEIYAPGLYTGYGAKTLPGVREAIEGRDWKLAGDRIVILAATLDKLSEAVDRAAALK